MWKSKITGSKFEKRKNLGNCTLHNSFVSEKKVSEIADYSSTTWKPPLCRGSEEMWGCYGRRPRRCRWQERTGSGNFGPMSTPGGRKVRCLLQWREETKSVKEAERSHSDVYIFLHWIYEKFDINQCKFRNGKMLPSFPFCFGKRPGGRQGGSGKQRWPQEQVDSNSVGKMAKLSTYSRTLVL